jgi:predicted nucleic acid-binding protein
LIAIDTSALVHYLAGERGADLDAIDLALKQGTAALPPVVLTEILCAKGLSPALHQSLSAMPLLAVLDGFWERAGNLRASLLRLRYKARLADTLIAQSCIDHEATLITRDTDFRHFEKHGGLKLTLIHSIGR